MVRMGLARWKRLPVATALALSLGGCSLAASVDRDQIIEDTQGVAEGSLGPLAANRISGWAHIVGDPEPVQVRIEINGTVEDAVVADRMRQDLADLGLHPTGEAGFRLTLTTPLESDDVVSAVIVGPEVELENSPQTY